MSLPLLVLCAFLVLLPALRTCHSAAAGPHSRHYDGAEGAVTKGSAGDGLTTLKEIFWGG